jgi:hypothetical protein
MKAGGFVWSNSVCAVLALLLCLATPGISLAGAMSRVLVNEPTAGYFEPRWEDPPRSPVLDDAHDVLVGLGPRRNRSFDLQGKQSWDLLALLGPAPRTRFGENDDSLYCYVSSQPDDRTGIVFEVYPEMVLGVNVLADKARIIDVGKRCQATTMVSAAVRTKGGLRLGMSRAEVLAMFGTPDRAQGRSIEFAAAKPPPPGAFSASVWRWIQIWFDKDGRVDGFSILANTMD